MISWVTMYDIICIIEPNASAATSSMSSAATSFDKLDAFKFDKLNAVKKPGRQIFCAYFVHICCDAAIQRHRGIARGGDDGADGKVRFQQL